MKYRTVLMAAAAALLLGQSAYADTFTNANGEQVQCRKVRVVHQKQWGTGGTAGTVIGGALGGLAGNQFGKGSGKSAMTAAGAVGGAVAGHEVGKKRDTYVTYEERCKRVN
ncbi:MAG TPA: glycine zipper 2TM domain-containing protein [Nevskia sp.]|jgi:uncharacterized protein YcfJ|nr:glycine zipper 2TM domain-containing protein [Nevskia sp.]